MSMSTLANANENLANPLLYSSCWRPCQRGEGMIEGECIFKAQKKWHLVNLSTDKKLWKIYQNLLRLTHPLKDWPKPLKDCPKPLEEKSDQNLWKVDFNFSFLNFAGRRNRQSSFLIQIFLNLDFKKNLFWSGPKQRSFDFLRGV